MSERRWKRRSKVKFYFRRILNRQAVTRKKVLLVLLFALAAVLLVDALANRWMGREERRARRSDRVEVIVVEEGEYDPEALGWLE